MNKKIVRLQQIELINFKNVKNGTVTFPNYIKQEFYNDKSEILGIYGQNGSGKTALVDAIDIIKKVLMGQELPNNIRDFILQTEEKSELKFLFYMKDETDEYQLFYDFQIEKYNVESFRIIRESLSYKKMSGNTWGSKRSIIEYDINFEDVVFKPIKNFRLLTTKKSDIVIDLNVSKKISIKDRMSFIFSSETEEIIKESAEFEEFTMLINSLKYYAGVNLFVIKNNHTGMINMNLMLPFSFRLKKENGITHGDLGIGLNKPSVVPEKVYQVVKEVINQMNVVLKTIIPGLVLDVKDYGKQLTEDGTEGTRIELVTIRKDLQIPLKYESDGIKKIVSILSTLISMYNNPSVCVVVDELDAGIFEYLLGEILEIISEGGKGQLIFTSHNLRPLEMLDSNSLIFTTTNPENRYVRFAYVKNNNNLRNLYYRSINIGGQKEEVYEETNSYEMNRAFRLAGRSKHED